MQCLNLEATHRELGELLRAKNAYASSILDLRFLIEFIIDFGAEYNSNVECVNYIKNSVHLLITTQRATTSEHGLHDINNRYREIIGDLEQNIPTLTIESVRGFNSRELWSHMRFDVIENYRNMLYILEAPSMQEVLEPIPQNALGNKCWRPFVEQYCTELETVHSLLRVCVRKSHDSEKKHACFSDAYLGMTAIAANLNIESCPYDHTSPILRRVKYQFEQNPVLVHDHLEAMMSFHDSAINLLARWYIQIFYFLARSNPDKCYYLSIVRIRNFLEDMNARARFCRRGIFDEFRVCMQDYPNAINGMFAAEQQNLLEIRCHNHGVNDFIDHAAQKIILLEHIAIFGEIAIVGNKLHKFYAELVRIMPSNENEINVNVTYCNRETAWALINIFNEKKVDIERCIGSHIPEDNAHECLEMVQWEIFNSIESHSHAHLQKHCPYTEFDSILSRIRAFFVSIPSRSTLRSEYTALYNRLIGTMSSTSSTPYPL